MQVTELKCSRFRNLEQVILTPCEGMNVICGENAQGKTNLIEAIWLFTGTKSFRNAKDNAFLKIGEQRAKNELLFTARQTELHAVMEFAEKRTVMLNDKRLSNPSALAGTFNAIVFSPVDLALVSDGPSERRRFMDAAIGQLYPAYIELLRSYTRAVVQRNQIIRDFRYDPSISVMLDVFEEEIAACGRKLIGYRTEYVKKLCQTLPEIYAGLSSGREPAAVEYGASCPAELLEQKLREARKEDMYSGVTSVGPHRDDLLFTVNGLSARIYGSQGQKRSVALAVKLAGAEVIRELTGEYPVCLLDDVMSELDPGRQNYILNHIRDWQSFLTCCDSSTIKSLEYGKSFTVKGGAIL